MPGAPAPHDDAVSGDRFGATATDLPPVERRLRWIVAALDDPGALTPEDVEPVFDASGWRDWSPERELDFLRNGRHGASRPFTIEALSLVDEHEATATLLGADAKRWSVTCWVEESEPHRITGARTIPAPPAGTSIRFAGTDDGPALAQLERRAPLRLGHGPITLMTFDHGDDYFAPSRLMEEVTIYVAEVDGAVAGVYCGAVQPVMVDGERKCLFLEHHVRIDPTTARGGVFWALCNFGRDHYARSTDSIAFFVSVDNHPVRKFVEGVPPWPVRPLRALLPCRPAGGDDAGAAPATAAPGAGVTEILNGCHGGEALFVPYDETSLAARLSRDSDQYGWGDVRVRSGRAAVGVGRRLLTVTKQREGLPADEGVVTHRATALDHGFLPGHEDDYRSLLQWWCGVLAARGASHLAVFTTERSPTYGVLQDLAEDMEEFDFWAFDLPEPRSLSEGGGLYVDPVYF